MEAAAEIERMAMIGRKMKVELTDAGKAVYSGNPLGYAHEGDAGIDLRIVEPVEIWPEETKAVGTGVRMEIPDGCVGLVFPRSGLSTKRGIVLANCVGVIDSGYRGEVMATLRNQSLDAVSLEAGERVCQLVVMPFCPVSIVQAELSETERGHDGFGSTGTL